MVNPVEDLLVISDDGTIIRMAVDNISLLGRSTQGVRVMRLMEGSRVISIEKTMRETEDSAEGESETEPGGEE
jgi:DNA gyrase subunit A